MTSFSFGVYKTRGTLSLTDEDVLAMEHYFVQNTRIRADGLVMSDTLGSSPFPTLCTRATPRGVERPPQ